MKRFLLGLLLTVNMAEAKHDHDFIHSLGSLKIKDAKSIEITSDEEQLLALFGTNKQTISIGGMFRIGDADHILLEYTLKAISGNKVVLNELDKSHLPLEEKPRHDMRTITVQPFGPVIAEARAKDIAVRHALTHVSGLFAKPYVKDCKRPGGGNWVVYLLSNKPNPFELGAMYMNVTIDKFTGKVVAADSGGGS